MNQMQLVQQLGELLPDIWNTVSETVSNASPSPATFGSPIAMRATPQELASELGGNMLMIQFAMANHPDHLQQILIKTETVLDIARVTSGMDWEDVDENVLSETRQFSESIIQGLCLGLGNVLGSTVVATGMVIRYQQFALPENLQTSVSLVRNQVALSMAEVSGVVLWLMDDETAAHITGNSEESIEQPSIPSIGQMPSSPMHNSRGNLEFDSSMEVLLDVPLEISVELGRVKMMVREVLDLGTGSIVEVDKAAGEPVDVMVNGRLVAKGEVVVIEDNFGVRITEILNPAERFRIEGAA